MTRIPRRSNGPPPTEYAPRSYVRDTTKKYKGVIWDAKNGGFKASISALGRNYQIGKYASEAEAVAAFDYVSDETVGIRGFDDRNFPDEIHTDPDENARAAVENINRDADTPNGHAFLLKKIRLRMEQIQSYSKPNWIYNNPGYDTDQWQSTHAALSEAFFHILAGRFSLGMKSLMRKAVIDTRRTGPTFGVAELQTVIGRAFETTVSQVDSQISKN